MPGRGKLGDFAECVIVGGFITEIFSSYGEQPGPEAWRDIERAKQEFGLIVYKKDGVACQQSDMSEPEMEECIFKGIADHLQILPEDEEKCSDIKDAEKRAGCLGEAAMAEYLERATEALQL